MKTLFPIRYKKSIGGPKRSRFAATEAQREAGNYKMKKVRIHGLDISIETRKGQRRKPGWQPLTFDYGYIRRTVGRDGDHVDCFVGPDKESELVYVCDQETVGGRFNEHKCLLGFSTLEAATDGYLANYPSDWKAGPITCLTIDQFKAWLIFGDQTERIAKQVSRYAKDASGHEHRGKGKGGGQFVTMPDGEGEGRTPEELGKESPESVDGESITLYRAGDSDILTGATSFSADVDIAKAYLSNPGFGGKTIYKTKVKIDQSKLLDVSSNDDEEQTNTLLEAAGIDHDYGNTTTDHLLADEDVIEALQDAGYEWIKLKDTFPEGAETYTWLYAGDEPELEEHNTRYAKVDRYKADDPFSTPKTSTDPFSSQPTTSHKPGDTKSENGQTYRLNQHSRWERVDDQGNVIDDAQPQEQPPEQADTPHPVIGKLFDAMKAHPDYQGKDVLTKTVKGGDKAYQWLQSKAGTTAAGGHVVDFGNGKIGYASTKGAMIFEPFAGGMKVHFSDKTEMAGHGKAVVDDKGNPQAPVTSQIPDHKPHREKADKARAALDEATDQWAQESGKGLDRHGHAAWRRHTSALRAQWRDHEAVAGSLERQHKARAAEIQKGEKERQKASQPPKAAKEPKQPKESPKQPVAEKPEEASPLFDQAKPGGDVPDTSKPQAYWDLPTSGRRAFDGVSKHLRDHELDDTPENRSAIQKAILSGHVADKSDLRQVLAAAKRKHDSGNLADSDSGVLNDAIKKKANRAPVESWKSIVKQKADEWDMTPDDFDEVANQVWGEKMKHHEATQQAGQAARLLTGLTAKDINSLENQGYDSGSNHPKTKGLDDIGRSMASQFPELGWGRGYTGEAGVDDTDYGEHVWNLLRAGEQKPPAKNSPEFMQEIEDYLQHNMDGGSSMTDAEREELAATPFHRIGLVDRYGRRLKSAPGQKNLFNEGASAKKQKRWTQEDEAKHKRDDKGEFSEKPGASALDEATGDSDIETVTQKAIAAIDGMDMGTRDGERDAMRAVSRVASDHDLSPNELSHHVMYEVSPRDIEGELAEPEIDAEDSLSNATKVKAERDRKDTESAMPDEQIQDSNRNTRKAREARNKAMLPSDEQTAKAMDSEKPAAHPAILRFESNVATLKYEKCHCVDEDGRFVLSKEGEKSQISFTEDERETIRNRKGVVFSHNHPSGTSFSREDIVFAAAHGLKQIRAVGDKYVYTMESAGEWMSPKEIAEVSGQEDKNVRREFTDKILGGRMTVEDAESSHWHEVWTRIADRLGLVYKRAERPK